MEEAGQKFVCGVEQTEGQQTKEAAGKISAIETQIQEAVVKLFLSHVLYHVGDTISRTTMRWGNGWGYPLYNRIMLWSVDLDTGGKLWKRVKPKTKRKNKK